MAGEDQGDGDDRQHLLDAAEGHDERDDQGDDEHDGGPPQDGVRYGLNALPAAVSEHEALAELAAASPG